MAKEKKPRLVPEPSVAVVDLQSVFEKFCKEKGSHDLFQLLAPHPSKSTSWKTTADPEWLQQLAPLFKKLVVVVKNMVFSSKKLKAAMTSLQYLIGGIKKYFCFCFV